MKFYLLVLIILVGIFTNYMVIISNLKRIRNEEESYKPFEVILCAIFFGGPMLLLSLIFSEYRDLERVNHHLYLISGIVLTILQVLLVYLLIHFGLIIF